MKREIKLDIGAGSTLEPGWTSWDIKDGNDARSIKMHDSSVLEIRASHVLEHISHRSTIAVLTEWNRVLVPGGRLYVAVPDFFRIVGRVIGRSGDANFEAFIMGGQVDADDFHAALFWDEKLSAQLEDANFHRINRVGPEGINCSRHWCSLNIEAFKPEATA